MNYCAICDYDVCDGCFGTDSTGSPSPQGSPQPLQVVVQTGADTGGSQRELAHQMEMEREKHKAELEKMKLEAEMEKLRASVSPTGSPSAPPADAVAASVATKLDESSEVSTAHVSTGQAQVKERLPSFAGSGAGCAFEPVGRHLGHRAVQAGNQNLERTQGGAETPWHHIVRPAPLPPRSDQEEGRCP